MYFHKARINDLHANHYGIYIFHALSHCIITELLKQTLSLRFTVGDSSSPRIKCFV